MNGWHCWCSLTLGIAKSLALTCRRHRVNIGSSVDSRSVSAGVAGVVKALAKPAVGTADRSEKRLSGTRREGKSFCLSSSLLQGRCWSVKALGQHRYSTYYY